MQRWLASTDCIIAWPGGARWGEDRGGTVGWSDMSSTRFEVSSSCVSSLLAAERHVSSVHVRRVGAASIRRFVDGGAPGASITALVVAALVAPTPLVPAAFLAAFLA